MLKKESYRKKKFILLGGNQGNKSTGEAIPRHLAASFKRSPLAAFFCGRCTKLFGLAESSKGKSSYQHKKYCE